MIYVINDYYVYKIKAIKLEIFKRLYSKAVQFIISLNKRPGFA